MDFDEKREQLLKEAYEIEEENEVNVENGSKIRKEFDSNFEKRFFDLIEQVILFLLEKQDAFFGQFMLRVKRNIRADIKVPIATIPKRDGFNMYFNPYLFLRCTKREMAALFKHEIYHIMSSHYERELSLKNRFSKEAIGVALDISINQFISDLPVYCKKIDNVNMEYKLNLQENKSVEEYAEKIDKSIKSRIKDKTIFEDEDDNDVDMSKAHEIWDEIDVKQDNIESLTKKTAKSSYNNNTPEGFAKIIKSYDEKAEISWQNVLKNIIPSIKSGYKKTITRRDRRQPERLDLRGRLPKKESDIIVAIDISASMSDNDLHNILVEILDITANTKNKITIIECDNEIRKVYDLKSSKDIQKRCKDTGATEFTPVFKYILENRLKNSILIYFTDGVGESELKVKPINKKTLWVLIGDEELSLKRSYGEIKRIKKEKKEEVEASIGLKMVNSVIHDWAR